jgi:hypothetical protein
MRGWSNIRKISAEIQRVLKMVSFERKPEEIFEPEEGIAPHKERTRGHEKYADRDEYEEEDVEADTAPSDDPGRG